MNYPRCRKGADHFKAKLTAEQVKQIRARYKLDQPPYRILAKEYGVSMSTIHKIVVRENWKSLPAE